MTEPAGLRVDIEGTLGVITLDRPHKHNSLTSAFWPAMRNALHELEQNEAVRAVVLNGAGGRAFSTGGDIAGFADLRDGASRAAFLGECHATFSAIEESPLPVIAAVEGWALGGGCELCLACDIVIAAATARFGMPEASVGLVPGFGILRAPQVIGRHWTKYMVMTAEPVAADEALHLGIVQKVVPEGTALEAAKAVAERISSNAPLAVRAAKALTNRDVDRREAGRSIDAVTVLYATKDADEGIAAFAEKRPSHFEGR
jgi:enoyl-CoA hydratase